MRLRDVAGERDEQPDVCSAARPWFTPALRDDYPAPRRRPRRSTLSICTPAPADHLEMHATVDDPEVGFVAERITMAS